MTFEVCADREELAARAAAEIVRCAGEAIAARGRFHIAFSGGSTPRRMLEVLADLKGVDWASVHIYQVDERAAPDGDPSRNAVMLDEALLQTLRARGAAPAGVWLMPVTAGDLDTAAKVYSATLDSLMAAPPVFDVVQLGLGDDGHTASLVPGDAILEVEDHDIAMTAEEYKGTYRMSFSYRLIERARRQLWLVAGADKREAVERYKAADCSIPAGRLASGASGAAAVVFCTADAVAAASG